MEIKTKKKELKSNVERMWTAESERKKFKSIYWTKKPKHFICRTNLRYEFLRTHVDATITKFSISASLLYTHSFTLTHTHTHTLIDICTAYGNAFFVVVVALVDYSSTRLSIISCWIFGWIKTNAISLHLFTLSAYAKTHNTYRHAYIYTHRAHVSTVVYGLASTDTSNIETHTFTISCIRHIE